ncbi:bacteriorhodopsin [Natrialbaceae archaeon GCM10025810]|uniref:bacteriorhodopsin n=1 Tax=Halovalidus salilacus TaxID=3075124 RepID=UPI00360E7EF1
MIPELQMYRIVFYVMIAATVLFLGWVARMPAGKRRYYLPVPIVCGTLALGYFGMSIELLRYTTPGGQPIPMSRYGDYVVTAPIMVTVAAIVGGATRRQLVAVNVLTVAWIGATVGAFFLTPPEQYAANLATFVCLFGVVALLVGPISRRARRQTGERALLFGQLRNLLLLLWLIYLVLGLSTRQGFGLLDAFGGVFVASYLDVLTRIGFGVLLLRGSDAVDQLLGDDSSGDSGAAGSNGDGSDASADVTIRKTPDAD